MATIEVNEQTKAGKLILETAILLSKENKGITVFESEKKLLDRMKANRKNDLLNESETNAFLKQLIETKGDEVHD
ncbi:MAG: hypothetical protein JW798_00305 [Prolixibacteraceae bacterium]|nr:hypothetical protein [Prolixibacteraceae bacterium]